MVVYYEAEAGPTWLPGSQPPKVAPGLTSNIEQELYRYSLAHTARINTVFLLIWRYTSIISFLLLAKSIEPK